MAVRPRGVTGRTLRERVRHRSEAVLALPLGRRATARMLRVHAKVWGIHRGSACSSPGVNHWDCPHEPHAPIIALELNRWSRCRRFWNHTCTCRCEPPNSAESCSRIMSVGNL